MTGKATLAQIRRLEAVSFRSFPATSTHYDGTWAIRLTAGHAAKRLNSVNPLDPSDHAWIEARLELARRRFESFGRPLVFRQSPLAPAELEALFDERGWESFDESIVMMVDLGALDVHGDSDVLPTHNIGKWIDAYLQLSGESASTKPGMAEVLSAIQPTNGLFRKSSEGVTVAALRCVHDNDLAGIFDVVTGRDFTRRGHAKDLLGAALKWAKRSGARHAWLQVVAENEAAIRLYKAFGFQEIYRYTYRRPLS